MEKKAQQLVQALPEPILRLHKAGLEGDAAAVLEAHSKLEALRREHPGNPLADSYHGSIMILIARDKTNPLEKLRWSVAGLKLLDAAVAAAPEDGMIRLLRGKAAYELPEKHFRRSQTAIEDYTFLIGQEERQQGFLGTAEHERIIYELGETYLRIGRNRDASACYSTLEQRTKDPELKQLLGQKLQSLEGKPPLEAVRSEISPAMLLIGVVTNAAAGTIKNLSGERRKKERKEKERQKSRTRKSSGRRRGRRRR